MRVAASLLAALVISAGHPSVAQAANCDVLARNNPAFARAGHLDGAAVPCARRPDIIPAKVPAKPSNAKDKALSTSPSGLTKSEDEDGGAVYRFGETTLRVHGYVRMDVTTGN